MPTSVDVPAVHFGRCVLCGRPDRHVWQRGDDQWVCDDCIEGYRLCAHGYLRDCYHCELERPPEPPMR